VKEASVNLLQLNPVEVSTQLMVEDFTIFRQIEATEYVDDLFEIKSRYGTPSLTLFCELVIDILFLLLFYILQFIMLLKCQLSTYRTYSNRKKEHSGFSALGALWNGTVFPLFIVKFGLYVFPDLNFVCLHFLNINFSQTIPFIRLKLDSNKSSVHD